jgi:flagellar protein FliS
MLGNPYQQYKEQSLSTLSSGEILVKLFEECIKQLNIGQRALIEKDYGKSTPALSKAQEIIDTLSVSLDMRFPISSQLRPMYTFISQQIGQANLNKKEKQISDVLPLVKDLRESFDTAQKDSRRVVVPQQHHYPAAMMIGSRAV